MSFLDGRLSGDFNITDVPAGAEDTVLTVDSSAPNGLSYQFARPRSWQFSYFHTAGTDYDSTVATGVWETRELNTSGACNPSGITLAADQMTFTIEGTFAITYHMNWSNVGRVSMRLFNITAVAAVADSVTSLSSGATGNNGTALSVCIALSTSPTVLELQHQVTAQGGANSGGQFGRDATVTNAFTYVQIQQIL